MKIQIDGLKRQPNVVYGFWSQQQLCRMHCCNLVELQLIYYLDWGKEPPGHSLRKDRAASLRDTTGTNRKLAWINNSILMQFNFSLFSPICFLLLGGRLDLMAFPWVILSWYSIVVLLNIINGFPYLVSPTR